MSNIKEIIVSTDDAICAFCHKHLKRGTKAIGQFTRTQPASRVRSVYCCDEVCLLDYQEKEGSAVNKMLNKLATTFN